MIYTNGLPDFDRGVLAGYNDHATNKGLDPDLEHYRKAYATGYSVGYSLYGTLLLARAGELH